MANGLIENMEMLPDNPVIADNFAIAWSKVNSPAYQKILVSVSGGADSDVMVDIINRCDQEKKAIYVWFDTGLEYQATKDHLAEIVNKYSIDIYRLHPKKTIPRACREYGQPFINKRASEYLYRLQKHGFDFANGDRPYNELIQEYPRCKSALLWWCNESKSDVFHISRNRYLKQFMIQNPPTFRISAKCCDHAKKDLAHQALKVYECDLNVMGIRKAEGGQRMTTYKSCFSEGAESDIYMPLFWYKQADKKEYVEKMGIQHSRCYTEYGLPRTGCAGCPFGKDFENELAVIEKYEPKLYKACWNIFGDSYEYTRNYREFVRQCRDKGIPW